MKRALRIYKRLLENGQIDDKTDTQLFLDYKENDVRDMLYDFESELGFKLIDAPHTTYMVPDSDNDILCLSMREIREGISSNARLVEAFTQCYIVMVLLYMFYGGKNKDPKLRDFLLVKDLVNEIDNRLSIALEENETKLEEHYSINFKKIATEWNDKPVFEDSRSKKTRYAVVVTACKMLEKEKLIKIVDDDREIRPTQKLDDLMLYYYLDIQRIDEIHEIFAKG